MNPFAKLFASSKKDAKEILDHTNRVVESALLAEKVADRLSLTKEFFKMGETINLARKYLREGTISAATAEKYISMAENRRAEIKKSLSL